VGPAHGAPAAIREGWTISIEGGCLCGQVRWAARGAPASGAACHCRHCQQTSGSAFSVIVGVPRASVPVTGKLAAYADTGDDSGMPVVRHFCPNCGSPILSDVAATPDLLWLKGGSLDQPATAAPQMNIWSERALPWPKGQGAVQSFAMNPPLGGEPGGRRRLADVARIAVVSPGPRTVAARPPRPPGRRPTRT